MNKDELILVKEVLENIELTISEDELLKRIPDISMQLLHEILDYLEEKGWIMIGSKGIL